MSRDNRVSTILICHAEEPLHTEGIARWLRHNSDLKGIIIIHDTKDAKRKRVKRELKRSGLLGLIDVLLYRAYYLLRHGARDRASRKLLLNTLRDRFQDSPAEPRLDVRSPNGPDVEEFLKRTRPQLALAFCKHLLKPSIFDIPTHGTFVLHPGICPEYRNAHGCFWALTRGDRDKVGMTLLRIDEGVDTGPIYGYFTYPFDEFEESHIVMQLRMTFDNLDAIWTRLTDLVAGRVSPIPTDGRKSAVWGQPRLTSYLRWRLRAKGRKGAHHRS